MSYIDIYDLTEKNLNLYNNPILCSLGSLYDLAYHSGLSFLAFIFIF